MVKLDVIGVSSSGNIGQPDDFSVPLKATITELDNQLSAISVTNKTLERMFKTTDARVTELEKNGRY